jgi:hypothetical protein
MACTMAVFPSPRAASKVALQPGEVLFDTQLRGGSAEDEDVEWQD